VATCTLEVGERVVLLSKGGPPEAEYALFDAGDIILAATGPGQVREVGYHATVADALSRLESAGINLALARQAASAILPSLAASYARGAAVRQVTPLFGPAELFDGGAYDAELRRYEGRWFDLPALALDVEISRATTLMQAFCLVARLHEVDPGTPIVLTTREYSAGRRPGERSYRRVPLEHAANLPQAFRSLAARLAGRKETPHPERANGPTREELLLSLRERAIECSDREEKERIVAIEKAMSPRSRPPRGPLSDAELWLLEEQLSKGSAIGVLERLDVIDKKSGRSPATSYLRARVSLITGREPARVVAERAGALAMSMTSFAECELLAAEAWTAAGEIRRALPFARDLVANASAHDELRARARQIVESVDRPASNAPRPPSTLPPPPPHDSEPVILLGGRRRSISDELRIDIDDPYSYAPPSHPSLPGTGGAIAGATPGSLSAGRRDVPPMSLASQVEPPPPPSSTPTPQGQPLSPSEVPTLPNPPKRLYSPQPSPHERFSVPISGDPPSVDNPSSGRVRASPVDQGRPVPGRRRFNAVGSGPMRGGSQPPFRSDSPGAHVNIPRAASIPAGMDGELVATLSLPPGLTGAPAPLETLPSTVLEARVQFTHLSRELAREYEDEFGITLRVDVASIEAMQAVLLERYSQRLVATEEQALDVQKHGALLSEILARTFRAFWVDIAPSGLGYWAMVVPPHTRVWPFGRILRLIAMQHKERDLVAYYLELEARAR